MKSNRRFSVERNVDLSDRLICIEVAINSAKSHRFLRVRELDADQFLGLVASYLS